MHEMEKEIGCSLPPHFIQRKASDQKDGQAMGAMYSRRIHMEDKIHDSAIFCNPYRQNAIKIDQHFMATAVLREDVTCTHQYSCTLHSLQKECSHGSPAPLVHPRGHSREWQQNQEIMTPIYVYIMQSPISCRRRIGTQESAIN